MLAAILVALLTGALLTLYGPYGQLEALTGLEPPEERVAGSTRLIGEFLTALGEPGRELYARALWWDFLVALVVPAALALAVLWLVHRLPPIWAFLRWLVLIPIGFAVADVAENALLLLALAAYPEPASPLTATAASIKLMLGLSSIPIVAVLGVMTLLLREKR